MNKHTQFTSSHTAALRKRIAAALVAVCLSATLSLYPVVSNAEAGAQDRKEAISQALARSQAGTQVLGVKRIKQSNGSVSFAVKVIHNGRVKVINIPKVNSE